MKKIILALLLVLVLPVLVNSAAITTSGNIHQGLTERDSEGHLVIRALTVDENGDVTGGGVSVTNTVTVTDANYDRSVTNTANVMVLSNGSDPTHVSWAAATLPETPVTLYIGAPAYIAADQPVSNLFGTAYIGQVGVSNTVGALEAGGNLATIASIDFATEVSLVDLGKAEDAVAVTGDTGVAILGIVQTDVVGASSTTLGDYAVPNMDNRGRLRVSPGGQHAFDSFSVTTGWTAFNDDAGNIITSTNHVFGTGSLSFDKLNGTANTTLAIIQKTITSVNLNNVATGAVFLQATMNLASVADATFVIMRAGTDSSNYNEWKIAVDTNTPIDKWEIYRAVLGDSEDSVGNGWDLTAVTYIAVGVEFGNQADTLALILCDAFSMTAGQVNAAAVGADFTSSVNTANINLFRVGGTNTATNSGNVSNGTQRVVLANDVALPEQLNKGATQSNFIMDGSIQATPKFGFIDDALSGDNTLQAAVASKKIRVTSVFLVAAGAVNARFESGASGTALTGQMNLIANSGFVLPYNPNGWFETGVNTLLNLELSGAVSVDGSFTYIEVD